MVRSVELLGSESNGGRRWKDRREKYFKWVQKPKAANIVCVKDGKPSLPGLFLQWVNEYGLNTYRVPHRAADTGSVTVDKSVAPHGVHDKEAAEVSQKGKEAQSVGMCPGHLPETWGKETRVSAEWERERGSGWGRKMCKDPRGIEEQVKVVEALETRRESLD